jgi:hypothetical protein
MRTKREVDNKSNVVRICCKGTKKPFFIYFSKKYSKRGWSMRTNEFTSLPPKRIL